MAVTLALAGLLVNLDLSRGTTLSGLVEFSTDGNGNFFNGSIWNTRGGDTHVNLWVVQGTNLHGAFVNGPSDSQASISIPLAEGEHTYLLFANQGVFTPHHGLNLFFNGDNVTPQISVFGATQTSAAPSAFSANGGNTLTLAGTSVPGANALVFEDGTNRIELVDYQFADISVHNTDRVSQRSTAPDGGADFIGQFTLRVTRSPVVPILPVLTGMVEFSTDPSGNFFNGSIWNTRGADTHVDLWVVQGTNLHGAFVNGPSDSQAGISIPLAEGEHTIRLFANQGGFTPHHGLNFFFNGDAATPRISVFGATQTSAAPSAFSANGGNTLTLAGTSVPGANALVFEDGTNRIELVDYQFADISVHNTDRVSQRSTAPDGGADFIGQFTLRVSKVPVVPTIPTLTGLLEFSTDGSGNFFNGSIWNTRGGDTHVNLWVAKGTNLHAPFVNGPSDAQAGISIPLEPGLNEFVIYGNQGGPTPHHGLNLFFDGNNVNPAISVFGPTQTSANPPYPRFAANSSLSTLTLSGSGPVAGAGTLVYEQGEIRVELIHYRWADPFVYNIDRVSQPVVTPDGGPDFIGRFTLLVGVGPGSPPVPHIGLSPEFSVPGASHPFVIACDGRSASVVLDARGSTDSDGDVLSYAWFVDGSQQPFSTDAVARTMAELGVHSVTLRVSDTQSSANTTLLFEVITPAEAAAQLSLLLDAGDLPRKKERPLQASLQGAIESLEHGKISSAIEQLGAFENKVRVQIGSSHPELAASLSAVTQALIQALEDCGGQEDND